MPGLIPPVYHTDGTATNDPEPPRRGFHYIDTGVTWASYIAWAVIIVEFFIGGSWGDRTWVGVVCTTAAFAFVCYGYRLLRANKYRLWWRIPLAVACFALLPVALYIWTQFHPSI